MRSLNGTLATLCVALYLSSPLLSALADTPNPKGILEGVYVRGSLGHSSVQPSITKKGYTPRTIGESPKPDPEADKLNPESLVRDKSQQTDSGFTSLGLERKKEKEGGKEPERHIPIQQLAIVLNGSEANETFALMRAFVDTVAKYEIQPEAVYTLQIPQFAVQDASLDWVKVIVRGGAIKMNRQVIEQYKLTKVPTWIARTAEGDFIFEGYYDISGFLTEKGEIRSKKALRQAFEAIEEPKEQEGES